MLTSDQSQLVKLADVPATVVVGNPSIADVTTDGRRLFFHPRGYGVTNVLVLDADGKKLGDYLNSQGTDYVNARRIINGVDQAATIATNWRLPTIGQRLQGDVLGEQGVGVDDRRLAFGRREVDETAFAQQVDALDTKTVG